MRASMDENNQKKPLSERIEDTLDEALYQAQNVIYGEKNGSDDIPYTMEDPNGFRRPVSFATRRNLALKLLKKPWLILVLVGIVTAIVLLITFLI